MYRLVFALLALVACDAAEDPPTALPECPNDCFRGYVHLDCGDDAESALRCRDDGAADECLWTPATCTVPGYAAPVEPIGQFHDPGWGWYSPYWGAQPWRRDTAMALGVEVGEVVPQDIACDCVLEDPPANRDTCFGTNGFCGPVGTFNTSPVAVEGWQPDTGMLILSGGMSDAFVGFSLMLEVDVPNGRARACLIGFHDSYQPRPDPQCADRGMVTLSSLPATAEDVATTQVRLRVEFDTVRFTDGSPFRIRDVVLEFATDAGAPIVIPAL